MTLALQLFKNSIDTQEKLRLNLHSLSVSELLEYGRKPRSHISFVFWSILFCYGGGGGHFVPLPLFASRWISLHYSPPCRWIIVNYLGFFPRTAVVDQLLANGTSRSWLLGNVLVTVTVSKRTPSNMPCAYCSSGRSSVSKSLPRVDNGSTSHARTGTKSTTADLRFIENEGSFEIKHQVRVCLNNTYPYYFDFENHLFQANQNPLSSVVTNQNSTNQNWVALLGVDKQISNATNFHRLCYSIIQSRHRLTKFRLYSKVYSIAQHF